MRTRKLPVFASAIVQDSDTGTLRIATEAGFDCTKTITSRSQEVVRESDIAERTWPGMVFGGTLVGLGAGTLIMTPAITQDTDLLVFALPVAAAALAAGGYWFGRSIYYAAKAGHRPVDKFGSILETGAKKREIIKECHSELLTGVGLTATIPAILPDGEVTLKLYDAAIPSNGVVEIPFRDAMDSALPEWQEIHVRVTPMMTITIGESGQSTWTDSVGKTHEINIKREFPLNDTFKESVGGANWVNSKG